MTIADDPQAREAQARVRTIRAGRDDWEQIGRAQSFDAWKAIGAALSIGKRHALKVTGANAARGRNYSREFGLWLQRFGFESMPKSVRSVAIELHEHIGAIEQWRMTLPERQRRRLIHPLSVTRRWRAATGQFQAQRFRDAKWEAQHHWQRFCACLQALPADQAAPLWQAAQAELEAMRRAGNRSPGADHRDRTLIAAGYPSGCV